MQQEQQESQVTAVDLLLLSEAMLLTVSVTETASERSGMDDATRPTDVEKSAAIHFD